MWKTWEAANLVFQWIFLLNSVKHKFFHVSIVKKYFIGLYVVTQWSLLGYWCGAESHLPDIRHGTIWPVGYLKSSMFHKMESFLTAEIKNCFSNISFRLRKENNCDNFESCWILGDGSCLYRSVSKEIFKSNQYRSLIKFGTLLSLKININ